MEDQTSLRFYYSGYEKCSAGHFFGTAVRVHYLIHFVINGKGTYQVGEETYSVCTHQAFLIRPQEIASYAADEEEPWEYLWFAFNGKEADRLIASFFSRDTPYVISTERTLLLTQLLQTAIPSFQKRKLEQLELSGWCKLFFSCFNRQEEKRQKSFKDGYLLDVLNYMRYNYMHDINIDQLSAQLGVDRTYLYKIVKNHTGSSPKEYITLLRVEAAKNMLQHSKYSITDIAVACGFHDHSSFCKIFKRYESYTPSHYRQLWEKSRR